MTQLYSFFLTCIMIQSYLTLTILYILIQNKCKCFIISSDFKSKFLSRHRKTELFYLSKKEEIICFPNTQSARERKINSS